MPGMEWAEKDSILNDGARGSWDTLALHIR